jgi:hypothetical protein
MNKHEDAMQTRLDALETKASFIHQAITMATLDRPSMLPKAILAHGKTWRALQ